MVLDFFTDIISMYHFDFLNDHENAIKKEKLTTNIIYLCDDGFCPTSSFFTDEKCHPKFLAIAKIVNSSSARVDNFEHSTLSLIHQITTFRHKRRLIVLRIVRTQKNAAFHDFSAINCNLLLAEGKRKVRIWEV